MTQGFTLSTDKAGKDQGKAAYANAYIGFGVERGEGAVQDALGTPAGQTKEGYNVWGK
ncbi:MAG: hypothetical protein LBL13_00490 [Bacteroidales bacterium]|jgi:hypothetical protein|nr:hypothetical protein [Bacteroidales bacterium]